MEISALLETRSSLLWTLMHKALALHDMVLVVLRCRSCAAFLPGRSSLFHAYSFAARPPHRCHTNPKPYRTLINQSSQRLQRGCTASPWTRARQKAFRGLRRRTASARQEGSVATLESNAVGCDN